MLITHKNQYIARMPDGRLFCCYHTSADGGCVRIYEGGRWGKPNVIAPEAQPHISAALDHHGVFYLIYQDRSGNIHLQRYHNEWRSRLLIKNEEGTSLPSRVHIHPLIDEGGLSLLYNSGGGLMLRAMDFGGGWGQPYLLDSALAGGEFVVQNLSSSHALVFYNKVGAETVLGYREVSPNRYTSFNPVWRMGTGQNVADASFLATNDSLHGIIITKGMFSSQLVYMRKLDESFNGVQVLAETKNLGNCLLMYVGGILYAFVMSDGQLIYTSSKDHGTSFSPMKRYTNKFCAIPAKATYLSHRSMSEGEYLVRHLYVDRNNVADIQLLPDLYEAFYPISNNKATQGEISEYKEKLEKTQAQLEEKDALLHQLRKRLNDEDT